MNIKALIITAIITVLSLSGFYHCSKSASRPDIENTILKKEEHKSKKSDIKYSIRTIEHNGLTYPYLNAEFKGRKYKDFGEFYPVSIDHVMDFDEDGYEDALILGSGCWGGYACASYSYSFCYYSINDKKFLTSEDFGSNAKLASVEKWKGKNSVIIKSYTLNEIHESTGRYILKNGHAVQVEFKENVKLKAMAELEYADEDTGSNLFFDLDLDGVKDCLFMESAFNKYGNAMTWKYVKFANGKTIETDSWCERIGVLSSKTNGVHDIVLNLDEIMIWDGKKYIFKEVGNSSKL